MRMLTIIALTLCVVLPLAWLNGHARLLDADTMTYVGIGIGAAIGLAVQFCAEQWE